ncbi:DUF2071 domain-containing protein [Bacillus salitolerans]|uniref:DUF2071 domain-containing protein n=1 Tax=Bacillus salitolerans TaxID=1437434 RepID=A0ABW4LS30_9BACI
MQFKTMNGIIKRRLLINYQLDPKIAVNLLPKPFSPKLIKGKAIIGVCLIRLEKVRPSLMSSIPFGISSENAAHRMAVEWVEEDTIKEGVYIFRRDTNSKINTVVGGRFFPGIHNYANIKVSELNERVEFSLASQDKEVEIYISGSQSEEMDQMSVFTSINEISDFFKSGSDGYSPTQIEGCYQGLCLQTDDWNMSPFKVEKLKVTYLQNRLKIPSESLQFDSVVIMRNVHHKWKSLNDISN